MSISDNKETCRTEDDKVSYKDRIDDIKFITVSRSLSKLHVLHMLDVRETNSVAMMYAP